MTPAKRPKLGTVRKAPNGGKGRPKGAVNKTTASVKQALTLAFEGIGGVQELEAWGREHRTEFYGLWAKLLPKEVEVAGKDGRALRVVFSHE